jgi:hypothetical protein
LGGKLRAGLCGAVLETTRFLQGILERGADWPKM